MDESKLAKVGILAIAYLVAEGYIGENAAWETCPSCCATADSRERYGHWRGCLFAPLLDAIAALAPPVT